MLGHKARLDELLRLHGRPYVPWTKAFTTTRKDLRKAIQFLCGSDGPLHGGGSITEAEADAVDRQVGATQSASVFSALAATAAPTQTPAAAAASASAAGDAPGVATGEAGPEVKPTTPASPAPRTPAAPAASISAAAAAASPSSVPSSLDSVPLDQELILFKPSRGQQQRGVLVIPRALASVSAILAHVTSPLIVGGPYTEWVCQEYIRFPLTVSGEALAAPSANDDAMDVPLTLPKAAMHLPRVSVEAPPRRSVFAFPCYNGQPVPPPPGSPHAAASSSSRAAATGNAGPVADPSVHPVPFTPAYLACSPTSCSSNSEGLHPEGPDAAPAGEAAPLEPVEAPLISTAPTSVMRTRPQISAVRPAGGSPAPPFSAGPSARQSESKGGEAFSSTAAGVPPDHGAAGVTVAGTCAVPPPIVRPLSTAQLPAQADGVRSFVSDAGIPCVRGQQYKVHFRVYAVVVHNADRPRAYDLHLCSLFKLYHSTAPYDWSVRAGSSVPSRVSHPASLFHSFLRLSPRPLLTPRLINPAAWLRPSTRPSPSTSRTAWATPCCPRPSSTRSSTSSHTSSRTPVRLLYGFLSFS